MANICINEFYFSGEETKLNKLFDLFEENEFLGNIFLKNGIQGADKAQGYIVDIDRDFWYVTIDTKWIPHRETIESLLAFIGGDIKYCCYSEECGNGLYEVYDPNGLGEFAAYQIAVRYELFGEDEEANISNIAFYDGVLDRKTFNEMVEDLSGKEIESIEDGRNVLVSMLKNEDSYISVHEIRTVS